MLDCQQLGHNNFPAKLNSKHLQWNNHHDLAIHFLWCRVFAASCFDFRFLIFCFTLPLIRHRVAQAGQGISARTVWARSASSAAAWLAEHTQGITKWWRIGGRLLLVTFLGEARKVTSCRAAPGEVEVVVDLIWCVKYPLNLELILKL